MQLINKKLLFSFLVIFLLFLTPILIYANESIDLIVHFVEGTPLADKIGYSIAINLSALQPNGSSISGLSKDDFKVTEDSQQVEIEDINSSNNLPINVLLLIDTSGSMKGSPIQDARSAAAKFISEFDEKDQIALATFNEEIVYVSDFTDDIQKASNSVGQINAVDLASTCLYDAAYSTAQKMATVESGRRAVILLTDGQDYKSGNRCSVHTLDDVINLASEGNTRVPFYIIALGDEVDEKALMRLSEMSGGTYQYTPSSNQLDSTFDTLSSQLRTQYILTYTSTAAPGAHTVAVEMKYENQVVQDTRSFTLPALPQILTILSPTEGQNIKGSTKLAVSLSGSGKPIEKVVFYLGNEVIGSDTTTPYELDYDFNSDQLGSNIIKAVALDTQGEEIVSSEVNVNIATASGSSPVEVANSVFSNPLYYGLIGGGFITLAIAVLLILSRKKKKIKSVFNNDFKLRENVNNQDDHTIDFSILSDEEQSNFTGGILAILTVIYSDDIAMVGQQLNITHLPVKIGRGASNDIVVSNKDGAVSRNHAMIEQRGGEIVFMEIIGTDERGNPKMPTYGTFVNEKNIRDQSVSLNEGDEIRLGTRFKMKFNKVINSSATEDKTIDGIELISEDKTREFHGEEDETNEIPKN